jgi:hypothetical protein
MRPISLSVLVILLFACSPEQGEPRSQSPSSEKSGSAQQMPSTVVATPKKVDVSGYYLLAGDIPLWCSDIDVMELSNVEPVPDSSAAVGFHLRVVPLWGVIALKADSGQPRTDFRLVNVRLDGARLIFASREVDSISYDFAGQFLRLGDFVEDWRPNEIILKGHFRKLKAGTVLGEADVAFIYSPGD